MKLKNLAATLAAALLGVSGAAQGAEVLRTENATMNIGGRLQLLGFAQKNRGMTRVLIGDALVHENERLQARINQLHDRVESTLRQALRFAAMQNELPAAPDPAVRANLIMSYITGRWHQFAKSGFKRDPLQHWNDQLPTLLAQ